MKSKLLKLKELTLGDMCFVLMYVGGSLSILNSATRNDWSHLLCGCAFILAVIGWSIEKRKTSNFLSAFDAISENHDKLIEINKELSDKYKQELQIVQGLISENKDLKVKLKSAKMENSRIRKGGKGNE